MKKNIQKKVPKKIKRIKKEHKKNTSFPLISIVLLIGLLAGAIIGYFIFNNTKPTAKTHITKSIVKKEQPIKQKIKPITYEEKTKALEIEYTNNIDNNIYIEQKIEEPIFHYEEPDYGKIDDIEIKPQTIQQQEIPKTKPKIESTKKQNIEPKIIKHTKPLLAIIIDDVTTSSQIKKIKDIGYIVNMSFLPPTSGHKKSAKITKKLDNYMIHLPLQASSSRYEEVNTLHIDDTLYTIKNRIDALQQLYPKAKYINNHTGSKFTSNQIAMDKLFKVLKQYNYIFVDSRTTAKTVAGISAKKYGVKMLSRNIFLDNNKNKTYIQNQLKKAIKNAKKYGSAIAIGHPYTLTFKTLKESKHLLKDIDLVYINQL